MDPKSVFCAFFKQGLCKKGDKCKFSHDPACERKAAKINIYADAREEDTMDGWDQDKLNEVVNKKHGAEKSNKTDIVSLCQSLHLSNVIFLPWASHQTFLVSYFRWGFERVLNVMVLIIEAVQCTIVNVTCQLATTNSKNFANEFNIF